MILSKMVLDIIRRLLLRQSVDLTRTFGIQNNAEDSALAIKTRQSNPAKQTPVHEIHNAELLALIPRESKNVVEIGCSSGALAREFKKINPNCHYVGIDLVQDYIELAKRYCDVAYAINIENVDEEFFVQYGETDCWVFGDVLEHLYDPWSILRKLRNAIPNKGCIVACIPNVQHWSMFAKLSCGEFVYEDIGLLDRTHIRWFTRKTVVQMFNAAGFEIIEIYGRVFDEPEREKFLPMIGELAKTCGADPNVAINDAKALQFVLRAIPR